MLEIVHQTKIELETKLDNQTEVHTEKAPINCKKSSTHSFAYTHVQCRWPTSYTSSRSTICVPHSVYISIHQHSLYIVRVDSELETFRGLQGQSYFAHNPCARRKNSIVMRRFHRQVLAYSTKLLQHFFASVLLLSLSLW